jgi:hypothetical protein
MKLICERCGLEIRKAKWYEYVPFFPMIILYELFWGFKALYSHKKGLFTKCESYLQLKPKPMKKEEK